MKPWIASLTAAALMLQAQTAKAAPLPQAVADVIAAAADDPETLKAVIKAAKKANPGSVAEIDAQVAALQAPGAATPAAAMAEQTPARAQLGGSISTGNTNERAFAAALDFEKQTAAWGHDLNLSLDYKREGEDTTKDRYFAAYSLQRKLTPRLYAVGVLWGERDRFAGYNFRFSESLGLGYRLIDRPKLKLRLEGGPALRQAEYLSSDYEGTIAARGAGYLTWRIGPRLEFSQTLVAYLENRNTTLLASSAITTRLQGAFSARASYELRHEAEPPNDRQKTDTTTRVTLLYSF